MALMKHPDVNASWTDTAILRHKHADVGVAVALDFGLITPIVFHAETKGLAEISNEVKDAGRRAPRTRSSSPRNMKAAASRSPIWACSASRTSPPSSIRPRPRSWRWARARSAPSCVDGKIEIATVMTVTMSCDHRVIDGATGAQFLQTFKRFIEEPASMLL